MRPRRSPRRIRRPAGDFPVQTPSGRLEILRLPPEMPDQHFALRRGERLGMPRSRKPETEENSYVAFAGARKSREEWPECNRNHKRGAERPNRFPGTPPERSAKTPRAARRALFH